MVDMKQMVVLVDLVVVLVEQEELLEDLLLDQELQGKDIMVVLHLNHHLSDILVVEVVQVQLVKVVLLQKVEMVELELPQVYQAHQ
jgi:hypothetical protein